MNARTVLLVVDKAAGVNLGGSKEMAMDAREWEQRQLDKKFGVIPVRCRYRRMGVPLKSMWDVPVQTTDWDELAEYARELAPPADGQEDTVDNGEPTSTPG